LSFQTVQYFGSISTSSFELGVDAILQDERQRVGWGKLVIASAEHIESTVISNAGSAILYQNDATWAGIDTSCQFFGL
jgi:hypothetical protein